MEKILGENVQGVVITDLNCMPRIKMRNIESNVQKADKIITEILPFVANEQYRRLGLHKFLEYVNESDVNPHDVSVALDNRHYDAVREIKDITEALKDKKDDLDFTRPATVRRFLMVKQQKAIKVIAEMWMRRI